MRLLKEWLVAMEVRHKYYELTCAALNHSYDETLFYIGCIRKAYDLCVLVNVSLGLTFD